MKTVYKTVIFIPDAEESDKPKWKCVSRTYETELADIVWNDRVQCYYFRPREDTLYSIDAISAIHRFMKQLTGKGKKRIT